MIDHTESPNATLTFAPRSEAFTTGRNAPTSESVFVGSTTTPAVFTGNIYIRPVAFNDSRARAILPGSIDFSSGQVWAGQWRLDAGEEVPTWIVDGLECSLSFEEKPMTAVFYKVPGRSVWAKEERLGPEIVLHVKRSS